MAYKSQDSETLKMSIVKASYPCYNPLKTNHKFGSSTCEDPLRPKIKGHLHAEHALIKPVNSVYP